MSKARRSLSLALLISAACLLNSCAMAPTRKFIRTTPGYGPAVREANSIGIVADVCLKGGDYIAIDESRLSEGYMLEGAAAVLETKGYQVPVQLAPFVGAFKTASSTYNTKEKKGSEVSSQSPPFYVDDDVKSDAPYAQAITSVVRRTLAALEQRSETPSEVFLRDDLIPECLRTIKSRTQVNQLLVIVGSGTRVSATKSSLQGCGTGLVTLICSGGMFMATAHEVSTLDTFMALIDLNGRGILWSNDMQLSKGDLIEQGYYSGRWSRMLLYHFPDRTVID